MEHEPTEKLALSLRKEIKTTVSKQKNLKQINHHAVIDSVLHKNQEVIKTALLAQSKIEQNSFIKQFSL